MHLGEATSDVPTRYEDDRVLEGWQFSVLNNLLIVFNFRFPGGHGCTKIDPCEPCDSPRLGDSVPHVAFCIGSVVIGFVSQSS